jgi:uncharacterized membrane protein
MKLSDRIFAAIAYIPILGWILVLLFKRRAPLPMFHVRQSIGLFVFMIICFAAWAAVTWVLGWIPFGFMFGVSLFTMVIIAFAFVIITWVNGIIHALNGHVEILPFIGTRANDIPL